MTTINNSKSIYEYSKLIKNCARVCGKHPAKCAYSSTCDFVKQYKQRLK